jgi:hypothetical protein
MTGPEHYLRAERLLDHAAGMLDADVAAEERAELIARQAVAVTMAHAHAALAAAQWPGSAPTWTRSTPAPGVMPRPPASPAEAALHVDVGASVRPDTLHRFFRICGARRLAC